MTGLALLAAFAIATNATPAELLHQCRRTIPSDVELSGRIILRNRKGMVKAEHAYVLRRRSGATALEIDGNPLERPADGTVGENVLGTDVTWSDLTLDYLWWDDFSFDREREGETVHGQVCAVVLMRKGPRTVRVWADRKTGALMQAEELREGRPIRRLWGTSIRKFGDRWMANRMEVETLGSGHRTKITVEELK